MGSSPLEVEAMAGQVQAAIWGPRGLAHLLPGEEKGLLSETEIVVESEPSAEDRALAEAGPKDKLLGLFTHPPSRIQLFASDITAAGYDPVDVVTHELGHRFSYDHALRPAAVAIRIGELGNLPPRTDGQAPRRSPPAGWATAPGLFGEEATVVRGSDTCPMCLLHARMAESEKLLDGLRKRAHLQHQIPEGLGGTIPLAQRKLAEAQGALGAVQGMAVDQDEVRRLSDTLQAAQDQLSGWQTPESISVAHDTVYRGWDLAFDINSHYWRRAAKKLG